MAKKGKKKLKSPPPESSTSSEYVSSTDEEDAGVAVNSDGDTSSGQEATSLTSSESSCQPVTERCKKMKNKKGKDSPRRNKIAADSSDTAATTTTTDDAETTENGASDHTTDDASAGASTAEVPADPNWTISEDAILRGMKTDQRNPPWAEIAKVLRKNQKECKARWKIIRYLANGNWEFCEGEGTSSGQDSRQDSSQGNVKNPKGKDTKQDRKAKSKKSPRVEISESEEGMALTSSDGATASSVDKGKRCRAKKPQQHKSEGSRSETASEPGSEEDMNEQDHTYGYGDLEQRQQNRFWHQNVLHNLYPPNVFPASDDYFSQEDCNILATCESQYRHNKWLEMQASFYNATGRMVPLEVIRERCQRAEETRRQLETRQRVERWVRTAL